MIIHEVKGGIVVDVVTGDAISHGDTLQINGGILRCSFSQSWDVDAGITFPLVLRKGRLNCCFSKKRSIYFCIMSITLPTCDVKIILLELRILVEKIREGCVIGISNLYVAGFVFAIVRIGISDAYKEIKIYWRLSWADLFSLYTIQLKCRPIHQCNNAVTYL